MEDNVLTLLTEYVNAATDLAEAVQDDIETGEEFTSKTVLALGRFAVASQAFKNVTEQLGNLN